MTRSIQRRIWGLAAVMLVTCALGACLHESEVPPSAPPPCAEGRAEKVQATLDALFSLVAPADGKATVSAVENGRVAFEGGEVLEVPGVDFAAFISTGDEVQVETTPRRSSGWKTVTVEVPKPGIKDPRLRLETLLLAPYRSQLMSSTLGYPLPLCRLGEPRCPGGDVDVVGAVLASPFKRPGKVEVVEDGDTISVRFGLRDVIKKRFVGGLYERANGGHDGSCAQSSLRAGMITLPQ